MSLEGKIQVQADLVPTNDNPRMNVTDALYVKGAGQTFQSLAELVAFHPFRMKAGMSATVINWPTAGTITDIRLSADPAIMVDADNNSIITEANVENFWVIQSQTLRTTTRVYQYSANGPGGGIPIYPYTLAEEHNWENTRQDSKGHKWLRFRDDDEDVDEDGIFDHWTVPLNIGTPFQTGDYVENRFKRQNVSDTVHTGVGTMVPDKYYVVESGSVLIEGDISLNNIPQQETATEFEVLPGRQFLYAVANNYTFLDSGTVLETLQVPPRTVLGLPNNEPAGWTDSIPVGADQLWQITGQKSVYGQLKSDWILAKIIESADFVRYSDAPSPHPDLSAGVNTPATLGSGGDLALIAVGWTSAFDNHNFMATRSLDPGPNVYTNWLVQKINEESGEYVDRVYKLFDINLDSDSAFLVPPTQRDATAEGWSDTPVQETPTTINYESQSRKFFNGELKTPWTKPVPYTGKDAFIDTIESDLGDNFKYDVDGNVAPALITLQANLFKGLTKMWTRSDVTISYSWTRVFNNGAADTLVPSTNPADDFYRLATAGTIDTDDYIQDDQRVVIKPGAVTGMAVFRCIQTVALLEGDDLVFEEEFTVLDVSDGIDSKSLAVRPDIQTIVFDTVNGAFVPEALNIKAYVSNIPSPVLYWYKWNGTSWVQFVAPDDSHSFPLGINGGTLHIDVMSGTADEVTDAVFTAPGVGADATLTSASSDLPSMIVGAFFEVREHPTLALNGRWEVLTVNTATSSYEVNKITGSPAVTEVATPISVYTDLTYLFAPDGAKQEARYAVSTHDVNPESADNDTTFSDFTTIVKLGAAVFGAPGENGVSPLLDNESHTVVIDSVTNQPFAGEITNTGKATTKVELYSGTSKLVYTTDYTISLSSDNANIVFAHQADGSDRRVYISSWDPGERSAVCTITFTYGALTFERKFSVASTADAPGAIILDVDSDAGFIFGPGDVADKTLRANLFDTSIDGPQQILIRATEASIAAFAAASGSYLFEGSAHIILIGAGGPLFPVYRYNGGTKTLVGSYTVVGATEQYRIQWTVAGVLGTETTDPQQVIQRTDVSTEQTVTVDIRVNSVPFRSRTISVTDVNDGTTYRAWTSNATKPTTSQDLTNQDPTDGGIWPVTVSGVVWRLPTDVYWDTNSVMFAQDANFDGTNYIWGPVYRLKGETGSQGTNGNFYHPMYLAYDPAVHVPGAVPDIDNNGVPDLGAGGNVSSLAQMKAATWLSLMPSTGVIWKTERLWTGQGVTFDGLGDPSTGPVAGGVWTPPVRIAAKNGTDGLPGVVGFNGWAPILAIEIDGARRVQKVTGWVGGTGSPPAVPSPPYIGSAGYTTLAAATDIRGAAGTAGTAGYFGTNAVIQHSNAAGGFSTTNSQSLTGSNWTNPYTFPVWVDLEMECQVYNQTQNNTIYLDLNTTINGGSFLLRRTYALYLAFGTPAFQGLSCRTLRQVQPGETLAWSGVCSGVIAGTNNTRIQSDASWKVIIVA